MSAANLHAGAEPIWVRMDGAVALVLLQGAIGLALVALSIRDGAPPLLAMAGASVALAGATLHALTRTQRATRAQLGAAAAAARHAETIANRDALTGLPNRRALMTRLASEVQTEAPFALAFVDVDNFKHLNDTRGHAAGDAALRAIAKNLHARLRGDDIVARWGGDEFVLLLPGIATEADAAAACARLAEGAPLSIGCAIAHAGDDGASLLRRADAALYRRKRARSARHGNVLEATWRGE